MHPNAIFRKSDRTHNGQLRRVPFIVHELANPCSTCESRELSVCGGVEASELARLSDLATARTIPAGGTVFDEGDLATNLFNVRTGAARLFKSLPDGRRQLVGFAGPGHFLGLAPSGHYPYTAEAIGPVTLCAFSRTRLQTLFDDLPAFEHRLLEHVSNDLATAHDQMLLLGRKTARERLASFLLGHPAEAHPDAAPNVAIDLPMTRQDIADYLGLTIETVSRTFGTLKRDGLIALPVPGQVYLLDRSALAAIAAGEA